MGWPRLLPGLQISGRWSPFPEASNPNRGETSLVSVVDHEQFSCTICFVYTMNMYWNLPKHTLPAIPTRHRDLTGMWVSAREISVLLVCQTALLFSLS